MNANVINLRIQFESAAKNIKEFSDRSTDAISKASDEMENFGRYAGEATGGLVRLKMGIWDTFKSFDLSRPIQSLQALGEAAMRSAPRISGLLAGAFYTLWKILGNVIELQGQMVDLFNQVGTSINGINVSVAERVGDAISRINEISFETTESLQSVAEAYSTLAMMRVNDEDLKNLTETSILTSQALGMSVSESANLVGHLNKIGGLADEQVRAVATEFANVQSAVGMTNSEMQTVIETAKEITTQIAAFGASAESIQAVAGATAQVAGMFRQAGMAAEQGTKIISDLFDPSRLRENAFLINRMGIGMQEYIDMMQGGAIDQQRLTEGLYSAAQDIANMREQGVHFMALERRAQMMGFSNAKEALLLAKERNKMTQAELEHQQELEQHASEGMSQLNKAWGRFKTVLQSVLAGPMAGIMEVLTEKLGEMAEWWQVNADYVTGTFVKALDGLWNWIKNIDIGAMLDSIASFFKDIRSGVETVLTKIEEFWYWIKVIGVALASWLVLKQIMPLITGLGGAIGGLVGKISGLAGKASSAASAMGSFGQMAGAGLQQFMQMAGVAAIILSVSYSLKMLSESLVTLQTIDWATMGKMGALLAGLGVSVFALSKAATASVPGLFALSASLLAVGKAVQWIGDGIQSMGEGIEGALSSVKDLGEGLRMISGKGGEIAAAFASITPILVSFATQLKEPLSDITPHLVEVSKSIMNVTTAIQQLDPTKIQQLATSLDENAVSGFKRLGEAMNNLMGSMGNLDPRYMANQANALTEIGKAVKDFALSAWVMGQIGDASASIANIEALVSSIMDVFGGGFTIVLGNLEGLGKGFTHMTEGIERLSGISSTVLEETGEALDIASTGIQKVMMAMRMGAGGLFQDMEDLGEGFKKISLGLWVMGEANLEKLSDNLGNLIEPLEDVLNAIGGNSSTFFRDTDKLANSFDTVTDSLLKFSELSDDKLENLADAIGKIGPAVKLWLEGVGSAAGTWFKDVMAGAKSFEITANAIAQFGKMGNITTVAAAVSSMGTSIKGWLEAVGSAGSTWFKDVSAAGEAFKLVAEGIGTIAEARSKFGGEDFASIGTDMEAMTEGIGQWLEKLNDPGASGDKGFFGRTFDKLMSVGTDIAKTGDAFQSLGEGISYITTGSAIEGMKNISESNLLGSFSKKLNVLYETLEGHRGALTGANILYKIGESIEKLSGLSGTITMFDQLAAGIERVSTSLVAFKEVVGSRGALTSQFTDFMQEVKSIGPVEVKATAAPTDSITGGIDRVRDEESRDLTTNITIGIQNAIREEISKVVMAINNSNVAASERQEERLAVLNRIKQNTR